MWVQKWRMIQKVLSLFKGANVKWWCFPQEVREFRKIAYEQVFSLELNCKKVFRLKERLLRENLVVGFLKE
jgi:hypothetical protein